MLRTLNTCIGRGRGRRKNEKKNCSSSDEGDWDIKEEDCIDDVDRYDYQFTPQKSNFGDYHTVLLTLR